MGWGSTFGAIRAAVNNSNERGAGVAHVHIRHIHPFPPNLRDVLLGYEHVLVPELNRGQLSKVIRSEFLIDTIGLNKIQGLPFKAAEIEAKISQILGGESQA